MFPIIYFAAPPNVYLSILLFGGCTDTKMLTKNLHYFPFAIMLTKELIINQITSKTFMYGYRVVVHCMLLMIFSYTYSIMIVCDVFSILMAHEYIMDFT